MIHSNWSYLDLSVRVCGLKEILLLRVALIAWFGNGARARAKQYFYDSRHWDPQRNSERGRNFANLSGPAITATNQQPTVSDVFAQLTAGPVGGVVWCRRRRMGRRRRAVSIFAVDGRIWERMGKGKLANCMHRWQSNRTIINWGSGEKWMYCYVGDQALFK